jgi:hypothetical protein
MSRSIRFAAVVAIAAVALSVAAQPANDDCFTPESISGFGDFPFSTVKATTDGEPSASCFFFGQDQIYRDIWFRWTATDSTVVRIDLCSANYDTKIAVYAGYPKGGCPDPASVIACNDDACGLRSVVTFGAQAGAVYAIRVGSYGTPASGGSTGSGTMLIESGVLADVVDPASGNRYLLTNSTTWTGAEALAQSLGGNLASVLSQAENDFIHDTFGNFAGQDRRLWIGFNDRKVEGEWVWSDGSPVAYTNWNPGEPNNSGGIEHYAEMLGSNGRWNDIADSGSGFPHLAVIKVGDAPGPGGCPADLDGNGVVSGGDLGIMLGQWGGPGSADLDGNGIVAGGDLAILLAAWGLCP